VPKYRMDTNTDKPLFTYLVKTVGSDTSDFNYWLYNNFHKAFDKMVALSIASQRNGCGIAVIYTPHFINATREYKVKESFKASDGIARFDEHGDIHMHLKFYIDAGNWMNPEEAYEEWEKMYEKLTKQNLMI